MRINAYPSTTTPSGSDVLVIDSATAGTRSLSIEALKGYISQGGGGGSTGGGSASAYVTGSGNSGIWRYRTWSDGLKECWIPGVEMSGSESGGIVELELGYPSLSFTSTPACVATGYVAGDVFSYTTAVGVEHTKVTIHIKTASTGSKTCAISAYVIGY